MRFRWLGKEIERNIEKGERRKVEVIEGIEVRKEIVKLMSEERSVGGERKEIIEEERVNKRRFEEIGEKRKGNIKRELRRKEFNGGKEEDENKWFIEKKE